MDWEPSEAAPSPYGVKTCSCDEDTLYKELEGSRVSLSHQRGSRKGRTAVWKVDFA